MILEYYEHRILNTKIPCDAA